MLSRFSLSGKVAIVTGAAKGNGRAIADGFVSAGAVVYSIDVLENELKETVGKVDSSLGRYFVCDITDKTKLESIVKKIVEDESRIDILVNNAGITISDTSENYSEENWDKTLSINLKAPFILSQLVAKNMIKNRRGSIINITSLGAEQGFPNNPAYLASKGGLRQLTKGFAYDWSKYNIRVNNLGPGYINTDLNKKSWETPELRQQRTDSTMLGRWGHPIDLVGTAIFLASDASSYITGQSIYVDGGWLSKGI